jgi:hypothetical protein
MIDSIGDFALLLSTGDVVHFVTIAAVCQDASGELWVDVVLNPKPREQGDGHRWLWRTALAGGDDDDSRGNASIRATHIVAAVDLTND